MARILIMILLAGLTTRFVSSQDIMERVQGAVRSVLSPEFDIESIGMELVLNGGFSTSWTTEQKLGMFEVVKESFFWKVSDTCKPVLRQWLLDIYNGTEYTRPMLDAFGKPPSGLMLGYILMFGHFDECLRVTRVNETTGDRYKAANYCMIRLHSSTIEERLPPGVLPAYGMCLPRGCDNKNDSAAFFNGIFGAFKATSAITAVQPICVTPLPKNAGFYIMTTLTIVISILIVAAAVFHRKYARRNTENGILNGTDPTFNPQVQIYETKQASKNGVVHTVERTKKSRFTYSTVPAFIKPLLCWHAGTNVRLLFANSQEGEILFLHGFRALTMFWIILGNVYMFGRQMSGNSIMFNEYGFSAGHQIIMNFSYAFDGLFLVTGLLVTYVILRDLRRSEGKINWALLYFHRWWRLTPVYVFVMLFYVYMLPYGIESPFKLIFATLPTGPPNEHCKTHWWTNILYINNFFPVNKQMRCMNWTWFLALDMQFFAIAPLIVFILYKSRNAGIAIIVALVIGCIVTTMSLVSYFGLPINWMEKPMYLYNNTRLEVQHFKDVDYVEEKPYTRVTPFLIGIALGYLFASVPTYKLPGKTCLIAAFGWVVAAAIAVPLMWGFSFAGFNNDAMSPSDNMTLTGRVTYEGLRRLGWSVVIGWIVFACNYGYGGFVARFLSLRIWRPFSNLTYGAYLVHMLMIQLYFASQRQMVYFSNLNFATIFFAQIFMSYATALGIAILVEVPLLRLERLVVRRSL